MSSKIEKNVSVPDSRRYPFPDMKVGDSYYDDDGMNLRSAAWQFARRHGWKFITRREGEGVRIWRMK